MSSVEVCSYMANSTPPPKPTPQQRWDKFKLDHPEFSEYFFVLKLLFEAAYKVKLQ